MQFFQTIEEVPVRGKGFSSVDQLRKRTDICCTIWAVLFSLTLFTIAVVGLNKDKALRSSLPSDADGKVCGVDYPEYGYLFYPEPQNPVSCRLNPGQESLRHRMPPFPKRAPEVQGSLVPVRPCL